MAFKTCTNCGMAWPTRDEFLSDPEVALVGYQANFEALRAGFFLFNHTRKSCQTTMAVTAVGFFDLHEGPIFETCTQRSPKCPGYCLNPHELRNCAVNCECGFVREILRQVVDWPKKGQASA